MRPFFKKGGDRYRVPLVSYWTHIWTASLYLHLFFLSFTWALCTHKTLSLASHVRFHVVNAYLSWNCLSYIHWISKKGSALFQVSSFGKLWYFLLLFCSLIFPCMAKCSNSALWFLRQSTQMAHTMEALVVNSKLGATFAFFIHMRFR